jgi:hypothetical protein
MASQNSDRQYYLITNVNSTTSSSKDREIDLHAQSWKLPYEVDDKDLMFDGKPLNMLYEENRHMAECHVSQSRVSTISPRKGGERKLTSDNRLIEGEAGTRSEVGALGSC